MIEAIPDIIKNGIWVEEHMDIHGKAASISRILAPVKMGDSIYVVKLTVKKSRELYKITNGEYSDFRAYDISTQKKDMIGSISTALLYNESKNSGPVPNMSFSNLSIREFLKNVKDNQGKPYVNADGTANYGIYFGDNKTGGVMFIENKEKPYEQRGWHGTAADYDVFDLGMIGTGEGAQAHGWGIYIAKDKKVAEGYRDKLSLKDTFEYSINGDPINDDIKGILNNQISKAALIEASETQDNTILAKAIRDRINYLRNGQENVSLKESISVLKEQIKKIEDNPKLSIKKFLDEVPASEKYRIKSLVNDAKKEAAAGNRKCKINDVLEKIKDHTQELNNSVEKNENNAKKMESLDLDNLDVKRDRGKLFEVDGITPAPAGTTWVRLYMTQSSRDYPRACGDDPRPFLIGLK